MHLIFNICGGSSITDMLWSIPFSLKYGLSGNLQPNLTKALILAEAPSKVTFCTETPTSFSLYMHIFTSCDRVTDESLLIKKYPTTHLNQTLSETI